MSLYHSFGPGDVTCVAIVPDAAFVIDEVKDASYSEHSDVQPVRRLGKRLPVGHARGAATVAGTLVCAQFTQGAFWKLRKFYGTIRVLGGETSQYGDPDSKVLDQHFGSHVSITQLPPFHLMFVHTNGEGQMGIVRMYNLSFSDRSTVFGSNNREVEETLQFQCTYAEELRLHRSLNVYEMQELTDRVKRPGFFKDPYKNNEGLVESLSAVSKALGEDESSGAIDLLLAETEEFERRLASGDATSVSLATDGAVVFDTGGTDVTTSTTADDFISGEIDINESFYNLARQEMTTLQGKLIVDKNKVHLAPAADVSSLSAASAVPVGTLESGSRSNISGLTGINYVQQIDQIVPPNELLVPDDVKLSVEESSGQITARRAGGQPFEMDRLRGGVASGELAGTYTAETDDRISEEVDVQHQSGNRYWMTYRLGGLVRHQTECVLDGDRLRLSDQPLSGELAFRVNTERDAPYLVREGRAGTIYTEKQTAGGTTSPGPTTDQTVYRWSVSFATSVTAELNVTAQLRPGGDAAYRTELIIDSDVYPGSDPERHDSYFRSQFSTPFGIITWRWAPRSSATAELNVNGQVGRTLINQNPPQTVGADYTGRFRGAPIEINVESGTVTGQVAGEAVPGGTMIGNWTPMFGGSLFVQFRREDTDIVVYGRFPNAQWSGPVTNPSA